MGAARSYPPPPAPSQPGVRKPGLARTSPARLAGRLSARDVLRAWAKRRGVSERDLGAVLDVTDRVAHDLFDGEKPLALGDLYAFPDRDALDLLDEIRSSILARRSGSHR